MKGITPIISTIVLLLITVALAAAAWIYISGFMGTYTEKSFTITTGGTYCDSSGVFHMRVVNTGTTTIQTTDWYNPSVSDSTGPKYVLNVATVAPKGTADFTTNGSVGYKGAPGGSYTISIATIGAAQNIPVVCP